MRNIFNLRGPDWVNKKYKEKRQFDRFLCLALAAPLGSMAVAAAGLIRLIDGVNPIYKQLRYGDFDEDPFEMLKLCTMPYVSEITPSEGRHDSRASKLGNVLRAGTFDEFPQLYNIWRGDMSFVGPRAWPYVIKKEAEAAVKNTAYTYEELMWARRITRPGVVDPVTVYSYRQADNCDRAEQVVGHIQYAQDGTLAFDLKALAAAGVLGLEGALGIEHPKLPILTASHIDS